MDKLKKKQSKWSVLAILGVVLYILCLCIVIVGIILGGLRYCKKNNVIKIPKYINVPMVPNRFSG